MPDSEAYRQQYAYLEQEVNTAPMQESDYFLVMLVDARHLDYSSFCSLLRTMSKHPSDGSKNGDVGHAWLYLRGVMDGRAFVFEGGQSGECGDGTPKYLEGVTNYIEYGYANPTEEEKRHPKCEPNPIKYMSEWRYDGFFQFGSGGHCPTFAAKVDLTEEQFRIIYEMVCPRWNEYASYCLLEKQCSSLVIKVAEIAGLDLTCCVNIPIPSEVTCWGNSYRLWTDPAYSVLTIPSPDALEQSLVSAVAEGKAQFALDWYMQRLRPQKRTLRAFIEDVRLFPERIARYHFSHSIR